MDMLDMYTDYLICQNKYATATGLPDMVDGAFSKNKNWNEMLNYFYHRQRKNSGFVEG